MKDSSCGRIISQRKPQPSLLVHYDTKQTLNQPRLTQLKQKYKNESRTPLKSHQNNQTLPINPNINNNNKSGIYTYATQLRQKYLATQTNQNQSSGCKENVRNYIEDYRRRVGVMNSCISQKLGWIQEQLESFKRQGRIRENREIDIQHQLIDQSAIQMSQVRLSISKNERNQIRLPQSMKVSQIQSQLQPLPQPQPQLNPITSKIQSKLLTLNPQKPTQSNCKLLGQFKKQRQISSQFTTFINRLKDQISLDIDFTQIMLSLTPADRTAVRECIGRKYPMADGEFFVVLGIQHDPLQSQAKVSYGGSIENIADKLHEFYIKIEQHFKQKLFQKYSPETITTLFEQIGIKQITLGHLVSYLNMRTGKQFRNRALVKLLRRLDICTQVVDRDRFWKGFVRI